MSIMALISGPEAGRRGMKVNPRGHFVPDFKALGEGGIYNRYSPEIIDNLRQNFNDRQIRYIASVLDEDEIKVIDLRDSLRVAIINSMSLDRMKWYENRYEIINPDDYIESSRQWIVTEARLLGAEPGKELDFEREHGKDIMKDFVKHCNGIRHRVDYILRNKKDKTKVRRRMR